MGDLVAAVEGLGERIAAQDAAARASDLEWLPRQFESLPTSLDDPPPTEADLTPATEKS